MRRKVRFIYFYRFNLRVTANSKTKIYLQQDQRSRRAELELKEKDFNNCQTRGKAEDRAGVQTLTEIAILFA